LFLLIFFFFCLLFFSFLLFFLLLLHLFFLHVTFRDLLHAVKLRHGTDGFTSPPKEGVLRIFSP
jgi:hypothetical protein